MIFYPKPRISKLSDVASTDASLKAIKAKLVSEISANIPKIQTFSNIFAKGIDKTSNLYFRAAARGATGNSITVSIEKKNESAFIVVADANFGNSQVVSSTNCDVLNCVLKWSERIITDNGVIKLQEFDGSGYVTTDQLFPTGKIATIGNTTLRISNLESFSIKVLANSEFFELTNKPSILNADGTQAPGFSIVELKTVLATSKMVKMPASITNEPEGTLFTNDKDFLEFQPITLSGGDGLPATPSKLYTGPGGYIVKVLYEEDAETGTLKDVNMLLVWAGISATSGSWITFHQS